MAKATTGGGGGLRNLGGDNSVSTDLSSLSQGELLEDDDILNADLILRSFGISDVYSRSVVDVNQLLTGVPGHDLGVDGSGTSETSVSSAFPLDQLDTMPSNPATLQPRASVEALRIVDVGSIFSQAEAPSTSMLQDGSTDRGVYRRSSEDSQPGENSGQKASTTSTSEEMETLNLLQNILAPQDNMNICLKSNLESALQSSSSGRRENIVLPQLTKEALACLGDCNHQHHANPLQYQHQRSSSSNSLPYQRSSSNPLQYHYQRGSPLHSNPRLSNHIIQNNQETQQQLINFNQNKIREERPMFTMPSPIVLSPLFIEEKPLTSSLLSTPSNQSYAVSYTSPLVSPQPLDQKPGTERGWRESSSPKTTPRPSPQSTPPPPSSAMLCDNIDAFGKPADPRSWKRSGRSTPTGKRSRPQTPTSMSEGENSDGGYRDREPHRPERSAPLETKYQPHLKDDEDKYNKSRKRSTLSGPGDKGKRDPIKGMLEELQSIIPHIGNPDEEKVSHAGLLVEASDHIRSVMRENNATKENLEALKEKIEELNSEIETSQEQLPEHGSTAIHRIISTRGKSIPDMFADHVRERTQEDWRYWVFTSIMGHLVHNFAQDVSNISTKDMERTSLEWVQERMSLQQLRKDAFRKLAKLCSKTSIMEDPSVLPEEARGFVALPDHLQTKEEVEESPPAFRY